MPIVIMPWRWWRWAMVGAAIPPATIAPAAAIPVVTAMTALTIIAAAVVIPPTSITPVIAIPVITTTVAVTNIDRKARCIEAKTAGLYSRCCGREQGKQ
ncbi:hypothetical protein GCM10011328_32070 [Hafnia psychrotolerans]|uniref:Secreted peptide n=1 Tax=Hafnia psychrotolerans TaxID=1477018 RepID=A0ABQ1H0W5_9GAMM|nr:hypothetical protein GCM10011328_32070 [Hafnia psychrotolerans]